MIRRSAVALVKTLGAGFVPVVTLLAAAPFGFVQVVGWNPILGYLVGLIMGAVIGMAVSFYDEEITALRIKNLETALNQREKVIEQLQEGSPS